MHRRQQAKLRRRMWSSSNDSAVLYVYIYKYGLIEPVMMGL